MYQLATDTEIARIIGMLELEVCIKALEISKSPAVNPGNFVPSFPLEKKSHREMVGKG
jgi:hypothetical protein